MLGNSKTEVPKLPDLVGSIGRIFLSGGCKVWGSKFLFFSIFQNFGFLNFIFLGLSDVREGISMSRHVIGMSRPDISMSDLDLIRILNRPPPPPRLVYVAVPFMLSVAHHLLRIFWHASHMPLVSSGIYLFMISNCCIKFALAFRPSA